MRLEDGDFVLPVDKPSGPTSHDIVAAARRSLRTRRVGHTGTLDPFASGLLLLCVGRATRLAEYLSGLDKQYEATARLGIETDTLDLEGAVVGEEADLTGVSEDEVRTALESFVGRIQQVPPQFSAKKVKGEAMHRRARRGERVALSPVEVTVHEIGLLAFQASTVRFSVRCSSGTYIRALARDLGRALGVGAHLTALRRTAVGSFSVDAALPVESLDDGPAVERSRIDPVAAVRHLTGIAVEEAAATRIRHGQRLRLDPAPDAEGGPVAVACKGELLAIGEVEDGVLHPRKVFAS